MRGHGVRLLNTRTQRDALSDLLRQSDEMLVQAWVLQYPDLAAFHPASVNTLRLMTYLRPTGEALCLSATLRMGAGGSCVDNVSSGGCSCGVRMDGTLQERGCSGDNRLIEAHPEGRAFAGCHVPSFEAALRQTLRLHRTLPQFALLAWDIAIDAEGEPVLIEFNDGNASIDFIQINNGPLFGSYTEEVLERVYRKRLF